MALVSIPVRDTRYFNMVEHDLVELNLLANDLLINVTSFFRNPKGIGPGGGR